MPVYVVDKPLGITSHDVVARARRLLGTRKVGHGGTLDPLASGVLPLLVGDDTKLSPFLTGSRKGYLAWVSFGASTPTLDAEGPVTNDAEPPDLDAATIGAALPSFLEVSSQLPPDYSAIKRAGVKGYEVARRGEKPTLESRPAGYFEVTLLAFAERRDLLPKAFEKRDGSWVPADGGSEAPLPEPLGEYPSALIRLEVRAGTYIRSFARDLGSALDASAFLSGLLRTHAGSLDLSQAVPLDSLPEASPLPAIEALSMPRVELSEADANRVRKGQRLPLPLERRTALVDRAGELVAVAETDAGRMKLLRVWVKS
ncbi:MAG TPA: tRNA pseudouridine(55) synthase TruB [Trueperaceae bacterium]